MDTLFQRVSGQSENKIAIHRIQSHLSEIVSGRNTVDNAAEKMNLTASQKDDLVQILTAASQASDSNKFSMRIFNYLVLSEMGEDGWTDEASFWQAVNQEAAN